MTSVKRLKQKAKKLKKEKGIKHSDALNQVALEFGFPSWLTLSESDIEARAEAAEKRLFEIWDEHGFDPSDIWWSDGSGDQYLSPSAQDIYNRLYISDLSA